MPALNITFTDSELEILRAQAKRQGSSMTSLAHDLVVGRSDRAQHHELVMGSAAEVISLSRELLDRLADR